MSISDRFKELRNQLDINQTDFGERIGVSRGVIKNIEQGLVEPKNLLLQQICKEYNVNMDWLLTGNGQMFEDTPREIQIANTIGKWLSNPEDDFKVRLVGYLTEMNEDEWELLLTMAEKLTGKK